jgi:hypothetical protein
MSAYFHPTDNFIPHFHKAFRVNRCLNFSQSELAWRQGARAIKFPQDSRHGNKMIDMGSTALTPACFYSPFDNVRHVVLLKRNFHLNLMRIPTEKWHGILAAGEETQCKYFMKLKKKVF